MYILKSQRNLGGEYQLSTIGGPAIMQCIVEPTEHACIYVRIDATRQFRYLYSAPRSEIYHPKLKCPRFAGIISQAFAVRRPDRNAALRHFAWRTRVQGWDGPH